MVIGGYDKAKMSSSNEQYTDETHIFDLETEEWTSGPKLINGRAGHTCARFEVGQVPHIVVVGGYFTPARSDKVEILDLSKIDSGWIQGPKMLRAGNMYSSVTNPKGTGIILSGGFNLNGEPQNDMYEFDCKDSINDCQWTKLEQKLKNPRMGHVSMLIPDSLAEELCLNKV